MTDYVRKQNQGVPLDMQTRYQDMGDGTHALVGASAISTIASPAAPQTGQVVIAVTGTAVALSAVSVALPSSTVQVSALIGNDATGGTVGGAGVTNTVDGSGNGFVLERGETVIVMVDDLSLVYVNGTAGDIFSYSAG